MNKILFLDRDGVINKKAPPHCHILRKEDFIFLPKVKEAIKLAADNGFIVLIITNQKNVDKNIIHMLNDYLIQEIPEISNIYFCTDENSFYRKPNPGMLYLAGRDYNVDKKQSWMIGDSDTDMLAAAAYGIKGIQTTDLYTAVQEIIK